MPRKSNPILSLAVFGALLLTACTSIEETSREYPIAAGRYFKAAEVAAKPVDSAGYHIEFDPATRIYYDAVLNRPGCVSLLTEGNWFVYTNTAYPEPVLKLKYLRAAGSTSGEECQTLDSLSKARTDWSESYWIRNITDSSFETCDDNNSICHGKCTKQEAYPGSACHAYDSSRTLDSYWTRFVKR